MALNNLEDRLECAIRHINTALDIDPWAQNLSVESMRMRIALMKGGQPEIIRCCECKHHHRDKSGAYYCGRKEYGYGWGMNDFCSDAERKEN